MPETGESRGDGKQLWHDRDIRAIFLRRPCRRVGVIRLTLAESGGTLLLACSQLTSAPEADRAWALGAAMFLMIQSPNHKYMFVNDLEWSLLTPIGLGQFRIWRKGPTPTAFVTWAFVTPEVDARLSDGHVRLAPQEWKQGNILWLMDALIPQPAFAAVLRELKEVVHPGRKLKTLQPAPGGGIGVVEW